MGDEPLHTTERTQLPPAAPPTNHGRTAAAWVTAAVVTAGCLLAAIGLVVAVMWLFWLGLGIVVLGAVVGGVLRMLGFGQPVPSGPPRGSTGSGTDVQPDDKEQR